MARGYSPDLRFIANLLRSYLSPGCPGFDLHGNPIKPEPQPTVDTVDDEAQNEEPAKSQKPN